MNDTAQMSTAGLSATSGSLVSRAWTRLIPILGVFAAVWVLYWPSARSLLQVWNDISNLTYTHGYLIAALCIWLLLRERFSIAAASLEPRPLAAAALLLAALLWFVAYRSGIQIGFELLLPLLMWGAVYALFGWSVARRCVFPIGYLYFAIPIWDFVNPLAQWGTVIAVRLMLRAVGIPAYFSENFVEIPAGTFQIAGGCSGLHFFIVALALAVLLGKLRRDPLRVRLKLAALAVGLALFTNWVRVFTVIVAGHLTDMQHYLVRVNHYYYGWALFALTMTLFFAIARRIGTESAQPDASTGTNAPQVHSLRVPVSPVKIYATIAVTFAALAVPAVWGALISAASAFPSHVTSLPERPGEWAGPAPASGDWKPVFENADRIAQGIYALGDSKIEVFTAWYFSQRQGKELGGYGNSVTGNLRSQASAQQFAAGKPFAELSVADPAGRPWILWYGYAVGSRWFVEATRAQLWYGVRSLAGPQLSRAVAMRSECVPDCERARDTLARFVEQRVIE